MRIDPKVFGEPEGLDEVLSINSNSSHEFCTEGDSPDLSKRNTRYNYEQE
jgi:hypothetical protein